MKLKQVFNIIETTAAEIKAPKPYIVGGMVRDILLKNLNDVKDIDITCGDSSSNVLGQALLKKFSNAVYTRFSDGHGRLAFDKFYIDFSNNFNIPNITKYIGTNSTSLQKEIYSRDFTINAMLMPLDLSKVYDITKRGKNDLKNKVVDTCLPPQITLFYDPRRIARIIYLCAKLDFRPSDRIIKWVKDNRKVFEGVEKKYVKDRINAAMEHNDDVAIRVMIDLGLDYLLMKSKNTRDLVAENPEILVGVLDEQR